MSNLAVKYKKQQAYVETPAVQPVKQAKFTKIEKLLYSAFGIFLICAAVVFIANKTALYEVNTEASTLQKQIEMQQKNNKNLSAEVEQLSRYERIAEVAGKLGLTIDANNVKGQRR